MKHEFKQLPNVPILIGKFEKEEIQFLIDEITEIQSNFDADELKKSKANHTLVSKIKREFFLPKSFNKIEELMKPLVRMYEPAQKAGVFAYDRAAKNGVNPASVEFDLSIVWVNFMERYEFNPLHNHGGVYSFVIWIDIPDCHATDWMEFRETSNPHDIGVFGFNYLNILGEQNQYYMNNIQPYEFVLFPADLMHFVNPFYTSDDYRVSVAGNFVINVKYD